MPRMTTNPVLVFDDAFRVVEANQSAAQLIGVPLRQLRGMHLRDFYHPTELAESEDRMRRLRPGDEVQFERWLRCFQRQYVRVTTTIKRRTIGGYRAEYTLPAQLYDTGRRTSPLGTFGTK